MGDAQLHGHRRSLIVSSTTATEIAENTGGQELPAENNTKPDIANSTSTASSTMYGPTLGVLPPTYQGHHPHLQYMPHAQQPRYHQAQMQPFNMQALQTALPSYPIQVQHMNQQPRYGPLVTSQYGVASLQIPTVTAQPGYNMAAYQQPGGYYDQYSQSPPGAPHGFPMATYGPAYPAPQPNPSQPVSQYAQWPQGSMPFIYPQQYGQQMPLSATEYTSPPLAGQFGPRRRSVPTAGYEANEIPFAQGYDPNYLPGNQRPGLPQKYATHSGARQRRGSPVASGFNSGRSNNAPSLSAASSSSLISRSPQSALHPSLPRGPPRKPRQSGHALWVGNLPPGTTVIALKDYFATDQIESVFLISKSNCAFVNYKTEAACTEAMGKFHDSRFQGVRLVCRLRRSSSPGGDTSETEGHAEQPPCAQESTEPLGNGVTEVEDVATESEALPNQTESASRGGKERYFIVKSLTLEDLDSSVSNGIWATQTHNEPALNEAYQGAENVFLIFSANKSGEYYGYARMASEISEAVASKIEWAPVSQSIEEAALPKAIYTPPTPTAPRGRIIDDSSRGTIFWEVIEDNDSDDEFEGTTISKSWGKPFRVEWVSTSKVPFYRTRGLRNPYNISREVKIARDGTELEPSVGKRLLQMFHRGGTLPFDPENAASAEAKTDLSDSALGTPEVTPPVADS